MIERIQNGEAQGIEAGFQQQQIVGERRQPLLLLVGDRLDFPDHDFPDRHGARTLESSTRH